MLVGALKILHLKDILFNFHMKRVDSGLQAGKSWRNPFDVASLRDLAGTEVRYTIECIKFINAIILK